MTRPFQPYPLTAGGHRQTLLGYLSRRQLYWRPPSEDVVVDAGDDVRLLLRASWQPGPREASRGHEMMEASAHFGKIVLTV